MTGPVKAIETRYKGYRFRSRLEARWAVFFDVMGIEWQYEVEGYMTCFGPYLPDFFLPRWGAHAEVKGRAFTDEELGKCGCVVAQTKRPLLLLEDTPDVKWYTAIFHLTPEEKSDTSGEFGGDQIDFGQSISKGRLWYGMEEVDLTRDDLAGGKWRRLFESAVIAARSARFEHGETP